MGSEAKVILYTDRDADVYTLQTITSDMLEPERFLLKIESRVSPLDFGGLCYVNRTKKEKHQQEEGKGNWRVELSSLNCERRELIRRLIDTIIVAQSSELSIDRIHKKLSQIFTWLDKNGHSDFLQSTEKATDFYRDYVDSLYYRIATEKRFSPRTANELQRVTINLLSTYFREEQPFITRNIAPISFRRQDREAPESKAVRQYLDVLRTLSTQLSKQLVDNKPFPLKLSFEAYSTYLFSGNGRNIFTPYHTNPFHIYNFEEGRIATAEEHLERSENGNESVSKKTVIDAQKALNDCNSIPNHKARQTAISLCLQCYAALFQLITGANASQIPTLEYQDALDIVNSSIKMEFTSIKLRAKGKKIRISLGGRHGKQLLNEYLAFRKAVLNGQETKYLFFGIKRHKNLVIEPTMLSDDYQTKLFRNRLRGKYLPSNFKNISPSLARIYKNVIIQELGTSPAVASKLLGHTEPVNAKHYTGISREKQKGEFSKHWNSVRAAAENITIVTSESLETKSLTKIASGACNSIGNPESASEQVPIQPNCTQQYGCLFCKHYCCHADKTDIHKLLSLIYVLKKVRKQAGNPDHADSLLRELSVRARHIVNSISAISSEIRSLVETIEHEVFNLGILTPFWERKLARYERVGIVL